MPGGALSKKLKSTAISIIAKPAQVTRENAESQLDSVPSRSPVLDSARDDPIPLHKKDSSSRTMQLCLRNFPSHGDLPDYPISDTLAVLLLLLSFPNMLITATYLLFSYTEYIRTHDVTAASSQLPFYMVVGLDFFLVFLTAVTIPALRTTVVDISYIVLALSLSGAKSKAALPIVLSMPVLRSLWDHTEASSSAILSYNPFDSNSSTTQKLATALRTIAGRATSSTSNRPVNHSMDFIKSTIAIHVCSLGLLRLAQFWGLDDTSQCAPRNASTSAAQSALQPQIHKTQRPQTYGFSSIWDQLLRIRADVNDKQAELTQSHPEHRYTKLWLSDIAARDVIFTCRMSSSVETTIAVKLNGLSWQVKVLDLSNSGVNGGSCASHERDRSIFVENLTPKTEYDFSLHVSTSDWEEVHNFTICTSAADGASKVTRAEISAPANVVQTVIEGHVKDSLDCDTKAASPTATLEESLIDAVHNMEEQKQLLRRTRKDNSKRIQQLQRDIDHLSQRQNSTVEKNEQRLQGRILSLQTEIRRTQDNIDELELEKQRVLGLIAEQCLPWSEQKERRDNEARTLDEVQARYNIEKEQHLKRLSSVDSEAQRIKAKADKLSIKRTKIQQDLDRISQEQDDILKQEFEQRSEAREIIKRQRLQTEAEYLKIIHEMQQRAEYLELYGSG